ncbi:unnamed protein product [Rotaria sp. Silwood2]|nr:unnamed protein product [Rotaria sp. Silwood2]CAF3441658.1 unnamed protein product [Rotaria sp. Silwood2]CAF4572034.1 unnamed protein product [Rotaria sp. Silwood2]
MEFKFSDESRREEQIDELLETFRTSFWLEERRWFVRCEWNLRVEDDSILLYTLPYYLDRFCVRDQSRRFKSTGLDDPVYWLYNSVHNISLEGDINNWCLFPIRYSNLRCLRICLPTHKNIYSFIPTLDNLTSLIVVMNDSSAESELLDLINRAPHLYSLTIDLLPNLLSILWKVTSTSIRRLDLFHSSFWYDLCLNAAQCSELINSSLGRQCEVLSVNVEDRSNVLDLVKTKSNVRALICKLKEEEEEEKGNNKRISSSDKDELVEWLRDHLLSMSSVRRTFYINNSIEIWVNQ